MAITANAKSINNGKLDYSGGQTSEKVYSKISDAQTGYVGTKDDGYYYNMKAIVKVGSCTYETNWKQGKASKSAYRKWNTNETSHYDYRLRDRAYSNWGGNA